LRMKLLLKRKLKNITNDVSENLRRIKWRKFLYCFAAFPAQARAHGQCQAKTRAALLDPSVEMVVVSNTFIRAWELQPYFDMAAELNVRVVVRRTTKVYGNAHGVPEDRVRAMLSAMEDIPGEELVGA
jgi:hypothetical protein